MNYIAYDEDYRGYRIIIAPDDMCECPMDYNDIVCMTVSTSGYGGRAETDTYNGGIDNVPFDLTRDQVREFGPAIAREFGYRSMLAFVAHDLHYYRDSVDLFNDTLHESIAELHYSDRFDAIESIIDMLGVGVALSICGQGCVQRDYHDALLYVDDKIIAVEWGGDKIRALDYLHAVHDEYTHWRYGDCWYYNVVDSDDSVVDSVDACIGDIDYVIEDARAVIDIEILCKGVDHAST